MRAAMAKITRAMTVEIAEPYPTWDSSKKLR
jgi:hypothetical protein